MKSSRTQTYLYVAIGLFEGFQSIREAVDVTIQFALLLPEEFLVEIDQLQEALGCGVVVPPLVLQKPLRHLCEKSGPTQQQ